MIPDSRSYAVTEKQIKCIVDKYNLDFDAVCERLEALKIEIEQRRVLSARTATKMERVIDEWMA